jgi:biofilm PGA synthesis protein PgaD
MSQPLIFTERRLLPRIIDVLLTIFAWVGFLYLIYKGLITALAHSPYMGVRPFSPRWIRSRFTSLSRWSTDWC